LWCSCANCLLQCSIPKLTPKPKLVQAYKMCMY
jgi:hypothetical protein